MSNNTFLLAQVDTGVPATTTSTTTASPSTGKDGKAQAPGGFFNLSMALPILLIVVFYFFLIRPQQKKEKERKAKLKELKKGDKVVTRGGLWAVIVGLRPEEGVAVIKIAENTKVEVSINAIEVVNPSPDDKEVIK